jgi:Fur family transcriptional regulator, zinc uptake regulator
LRDIRVPKQRYIVISFAFSGYFEMKLAKVEPQRYSDLRKTHEHQRCVSRALLVADQVCSERGLKLTPLRKRVLELVWARHAPIGAYDVLQKLSREGLGSAPPTVYRALAFLIDAGLVHRIDSLNAYFGCEMPKTDHAAQFLVCRSCKGVTELEDPAISRLLARRVRAAGFIADAPDVEIKGVCGACRSSAPAKALHSP